MADFEQSKTWCPVAAGTQRTGTPEAGRMRRGLGGESGMKPFSEVMIKLPSETEGNSLKVRIFTASYPTDSQPPPSLTAEQIKA